nr:hypothetical protein [Hyphomonas atlantica]
MKHPIALLYTGFHFLENLTAVLLALQLPLSRKHGLNEFGFRRVFEIEVRAFADSSAHFHLTFELEIEFRIAAVAFQIIKDDHEIIERIIIEKLEKRHHAGAFHKITIAADIVRKDSNDLIAFTGGMLAAKMLL